MAFYKDTKGKSRQEKRVEAQARGGFEDEGSEYSGRKGSLNSGERRGPRPGQQGGQGPYGRRPSRPAEFEGRREGQQGGQGPYGRRPSRPGEFEGRREGQQGGQGPYGRRPSRPGEFEGRREGQQGGQGPYGRKPSRPGEFEGRREGQQGEQGPYGRRPSRPGEFEGRREGQQGGQGAYGRKPSRPGAFENKAEAPSRTSGFRDTRREAPRGERPAMGVGAPHGNGKAGEYRYVSGAPSRYNERGGNIAPRSYDEQRRARAEDDRGFERYRYAAPASYNAPVMAGVEEENDSVPNENLLSGRNPIREALKSGRDIEKLLVSRGELSGSAREIVQMAKERHIPVQEVDRARLDAITHNHQGMLAFASAYQYSTVEDMLALAQERGEAPFLVLLDSITDPHNLGAIIRTAECAGAHGVIVQERRAVGLTPAAVKASAGAVEYLPVARVINLTSTIETLKEKNIWVYAADMKGEDYAKVDFNGAVALVIGAEGEGVSRRVLETCDKSVSLPLRGKLDSLNASVAAGVLLYTVMRAR